MIYFSIQGVKKGHKKYKERQAKKERKFLEEMKSPAIEDPSYEFDTTCLAEAQTKESQSSNRLDRTDSTSSNSTTTAESALENDPEFQQYMERHKQLYLQNQRGITSPPSYDASVRQSQMSDHDRIDTPSAATTYSSRQHELAVEADSMPISSVAELPADTEHQAPVEIGGKHLLNSRQPVEADSSPVVFELPGDLPAIMPESRPSNPSS